MPCAVSSTIGANEVTEVLKKSTWKAPKNERRWLKYDKFYSTAWTDSYLLLYRTVLTANHNIVCSDDMMDLDEMDFNESITIT